MRLAVIQEHVGGPWRWAILDSEDRIVGCATHWYTYQGRATRALVDFIQSIAKLPTPPPIEVHPSVQLHLFPNEKVAKQA